MTFAMFSYLLKYSDVQQLSTRTKFIPPTFLKTELYNKFGRGHLPFKAFERYGVPVRSIPNHTFSGMFWQNKN